MNGKSVRSATHEQTVNLLIEKRDGMTLLVRHEPPPSGLKEITLTKSLHDKLGVSIRGGVKSQFEENDDGGIYISRVCTNVQIRMSPSLILAF